MGVGLCAGPWGEWQAPGLSRQLGGEIHGEQQFRPPRVAVISCCRPGSINRKRRDFLHMDLDLVSYLRIRSVSTLLQKS